VKEGSRSKHNVLRSLNKYMMSPKDTKILFINPAEDLATDVRARSKCNDLYPSLRKLYLKRCDRVHIWGRKLIQLI
jgi:hypothetical protein